MPINVPKGIIHGRIIVRNAQRRLVKRIIWIGTVYRRAGNIWPITRNADGLGLDETIFIFHILFKNFKTQGV